MKWAVWPVLFVQTALSYIILPLPHHPYPPRRSGPPSGRIIAERDLLYQCTQSAVKNAVHNSTLIEQICDVLETQFPTDIDLGLTVRESYWRVIYDAYTPPGCKGYQSIKDWDLMNMYKRDDGVSYILECRLEQTSNSVLRLVEPSRAVLVEANGQTKAMESWTTVGVAAFDISYMSEKIRIQRGVSTGHLMVMIRQKSVPVRLSSV